MKTKLRLLSLLLAVILVLPMIPVGSASAADTTTSYTKNKVVSVLFDNSGSMISPSRDLWDYAKYALQTLMATLGKNDTLIITPMHGSPVEVDLEAANRYAEIQRVMTTSFLKSDPSKSNGTPSDSIADAVAQLVECGMKETDDISADENSENEYFLVVLTDGAFNNNTSVDVTASYFRDDLSKYAFFQSIYIGFTAASLDLSLATELKDKANFAPFRAETVGDIGGVMKEVANRITGRYPLDIAVKADSKTVEIPLPTGLGIRSVTVMATNTDARCASATYNGSSVSASHDAHFDSNITGMNGGFTTIFSRGANSVFSGNKLVLTLTDPPGADAVVSVLLEPALMLEPVIEVDTDEGRKAVDSAYINSQMKTGDTVYFGYRILEQGKGTAIDPAVLGGVSSARVTYNGRTYAPGAPVPLVEGKREIAVSVSMLGGKYSLYASVPCVVLNDPTSFRVEYKDIAVKDPTTFETTFTVYNDGNALTTSTALSDFILSSMLVDENGNMTESLPLLRKNSDGTFTVTLDTSKREYGTYNLRAVIKDKDGNLRTVDVPIGYYPEGLALTSTGADTLERTMHSILSNTEVFRFTLTAGKDDEKIDIPFDNPLLSYQLTVGGVDMTELAEVEGNVLSFLANPETLGALAEKPGEYDVILTATFEGATTETVECKKKLSLTQTVFEVVPLEPTGSVDRFALRKNQSTVSFKVLRDGVPLSLEEMQAALDGGTLYIDHSSYRSFLSPVRVDFELGMLGDTAVLTVHPRAGQFFLLRGLVTSMLVFGDTLEIAVHYGEVNGVGVVPLVDAGLFAYIWRILVILYIIQLIILALTFNKVKRIPQGVFVRVPIVDYDKEESELKGKVIVIKRLGLREYLVLKRLLPFIGLCFWTKSIPTTEGTLKYHQNAGVCVTAGIKCMEGELKPNGAIVSSTLKNKGWSALRPGTSFGFNKVALTSGVLVRITQKTSKTSIDQPLTGTRGLILKNKFYLFVSARSVGKKK